MASLINPPKPQKPNYLDRILETLSPIQQSVLLDESRFKIACCGRRSGKTYFDAALAAYTALKFDKAPVVYFGLTKDSAKEAIWEVLIDMLERCKIAHTKNEIQLKVEFPNGSFIRLYSADMENLPKRFRGRKHKLVIIDECAFYTAIDKLVTSVLLPTLADMQGSIVMTSSPGILPMGLFYEASVGKDKEHWSNYAWTLKDNPHFQKPSANPKYINLAEEELDVISVMKFGGDRSNPDFRREYMGEWVFDKHSLVYPLKPEHVLDKEYPLRKQEYAVGLNLSVYGKQGAVILKFGEYDRTVQVVDTKLVNCTNLNDLSTFVQQLADKYATQRILVYLGDNPAEILSDFKQRYGIPLQANLYDKEPFYQTIIATDLDSGFINVLAHNTELLQQFARIVRDAEGYEIKGQEATLADAFFAVYLNIYNNHLKKVEVPESEADRMERELREQVTEERNMRDEYGADY